MLVYPQKGPGLHHSHNQSWFGPSDTMAVAAFLQDCFTLNARVRSCVDGGCMETASWKNQLRPDVHLC